MVGEPHLRVTHGRTLGACQKAFQPHQGAATCAHDGSGRLRRRRSPAWVRRPSQLSCAGQSRPPSATGLRSLADGASELTRGAQGDEKAAARLRADKRRARETLIQTDQFAMDPGLLELDPSGRAALELREG